jgi:putative PIN family toxin of toxin-antitoxin system
VWVLHPYGGPTTGARECDTCAGYTGCVRVCIDTNVLIASLTKRSGTSARIVGLWRRGELEVVASEATAREVELVLGGGWLARMAGQDAVRNLIGAMRTETVWVEDPLPIEDLPLKDAGDLRLTEAALAGGASHIITTDREFLSRRGYGPVELVTPTEFLRLLERA